MPICDALRGRCKRLTNAERQTYLERLRAATTLDRAIVDAELVDFLDWFEPRMEGYRQLVLERTTARIAEVVEADTDADGDTDSDSGGETGIDDGDSVLVLGGTLVFVLLVGMYCELGVFCL